MDRQLRTVICPHHDDDLQKGPAAARAQVETKVVVQLVGHHGVPLGMFDVLDRDPVLERREVNVHTQQSYYESP